jgi:hypothetical protein
MTNGMFQYYATRREFRCVGFDADWAKACMECLMVVLESPSAVSACCLTPDPAAFPACSMWLLKMNWMSS